MSKDPHDMSDIVHINPWLELKRYTSARIALGRTGVSLPTEALLAFGLAHAQARDAVHQPLEVAALTKALHATGHKVLTVHSAATSREEYLRRPDLGRRLNDASRLLLSQLPQAEADLAPLEYQTRQAEADLVIMLGDGLSSTALHQNALPFIEALQPHLRRLGLACAPLVIASQARVALGDEVGELLRARAVLVMIGERPGLSSPDSLGLYLTWQPRVGCMDSQRNCISNVRPAGLDFPQAAHKLAWLLEQAFNRRLTGVALKDESGELASLIEHDAPLPPCRPA
ncbi:ethanolamine ammonia-lyase subunit EutC [Aeromonas salmonicida]|uniref:ethanolamine ammonia-lyase subunit EutC n=1 Tax=Aeromonas salmonicida TaxID=645 RepID=UPI00259F0491|nr:ethanolamine ammonia-lyase subunit EutC [Aeromonas salmonicida]MDM5126623.1 ethanolamine ammonia-lyase subunit EutC [Aeromonas salmonicida]